MNQQQKIRFKAVAIIIGVFSLFSLVDYIENNCKKNRRLVTSYKK